MEDVVRDLLKLHYDPTYFASMKRNFLQIDKAQVVLAKSRSHESLSSVAKLVMQA